tara:strand:- start:73 stop:1125 length:1053 start_codon:yes stop_codon:yes gene_type:complete
MSTYNRFGTPRAYIDLISNNIATGWRDLDDIIFKKISNNAVISPEEGSKSNMFDMRPSTYTKISHTDTGFWIQFDTGFATNALAESNFLAILNHNFADANAVIKVYIDDDANMSSPTTISTTGSHYKIINSEEGASAGEINPAGNGWTLITWDTKESDNQFVRIHIEPDNGSGQSFAEDVIIGGIQYGEFIDFPQSPELEIQTTIEYEGTTLQRSLGGNTYATSTHFGQPTWHHTTPWAITTTSNQQTYSFNERAGRISHSLKFKYLDDTDIFSLSQGSTTTGSWYDSGSLHSSFYNRILGQHLPFLFSIDKESTSTGDYGLFRLSDNKLSTTQITHRIYNLNLKLTETW